MSTSGSKLRIATCALALVGLVPAAYGISHGLERFGTGKAASSLTEPRKSVSGRTASKVALVIGNAVYPDANTPLAHPQKDAQDLAEELRQKGFDVEVQENTRKDEMKGAFDRFKARIKPGAVALVAYSGFGIQAGRESYMIPVDAQIWKEPDVRRDGISIESVLTDMDKLGADVKIAILDASRRNPYERRFRSVSSGLAAIDAPQGTLLLSAAAPGKAAYDVDGDHSLLFGELLKEINVPGQNAESVFNRTRIGVSRASNGEQVPLVSSSLVESFAFVSGPARYTRFDRDARSERLEPATSREPLVGYADASAPRVVEPASTTPARARVAEVEPAKPARKERVAPESRDERLTEDEPAKPTAKERVAPPAPRVAPEPRDVRPPEKPARQAKTKFVEEKKQQRRRYEDATRDIVYDQPRSIARRGWFHGGSNWRTAGFPRFGMGGMRGMGY